MKRGLAIALVVGLMTSSACDLFKADNTGYGRGVTPGPSGGVFVDTGAFLMEPITATFAVPVTTYTVNVRGTQGYQTNGGRFDWSYSGTCGKFSVGPTTVFDSRSSLTWSHPDKDLGGDCPNEPKHPGVISVHWVLNAGQQGNNAFYLYMCDATYTEGSAPGTGQPALCKSEDSTPGRH